MFYIYETALAEVLTVMKYGDDEIDFSLLVMLGYVNYSSRSKEILKQLRDLAMNRFQFIPMDLAVLSALTDGEFRLEDRLAAIPTAGSGLAPQGCRRNQTTASTSRDARSYPSLFLDCLGRTGSCHTHSLLAAFTDVFENLLRIQVRPDLIIPVGSLSVPSSLHSCDEWIFGV